MAKQSRLPTESADQYQGREFYRQHRCAVGPTGLGEVHQQGAAHGGVDYTFTGGAIAGTTGVTLSGTSGVGGMVTFDKANTFTGAVAINAGELIAANAGALGNASTVTVASGAALQLSGGITITSSGTSTLPLSLNGTGYASSPAGALDSEAGSNAYPGPITLTGATTINSGTATDTLTLTGGITTTTNDLSFTGAGKCQSLLMESPAPTPAPPRSTTRVPAELAH